MKATPLLKWTALIIAAVGLAWYGLNTDTPELHAAHRVHLLSSVGSRLLAYAAAHNGAFPDSLQQEDFASMLTEHQRSSIQIYRVHYSRPPPNSDPSFTVMTINSTQGRAFYLLSGTNGWQRQ